MTLLRKLEITGFKSFATPTTFVFDSGITAIIGPNGSGKSNIAEALRWVLGEQQFSNLRSRRTEDVIFAGSDRRAPTGLAEVSLTIDNSDGRLPIAFNEVTITRRANRSGENQYLINGSRVRLKDVQQLTAPLGQAHTIIGQGLVDAVLSQRPEDRRGLFEHAAGITGLRIQATQAERSLTEAENNAQRLRDILSELAPRVRSLARAAKQAQEYATLRAELQTLQRQHYGSLWRDQLARRRAARRAVEAAEQALEQASQEHQAAAHAVAEARAAIRTQQQEIEQARDHLNAVERQISETRHKIDLLNAESRSLVRRQDDIARVQAEREAEQGRLGKSSDQLDAELERLTQKIDEYEREHAELEDANRAARIDREAVEQSIAGIDREMLRLARERAEIEGALESIDERQRRASAEHEGLKQRAREQAEALTTAIAERDQLAEQIESPEIERLQQAVDEAAAEVERLQQEQAEQQEQIDQLYRELNAKRSRHEILERAHEQGEGLYAGVRALLKACRGGELQMPGLIGAVSEVVRVPGEYEIAIEVALGGRLQDIIVRSWSDAEQGIGYLRERKRGRATFLPLETIRDSRPASAPDDPDVIGVASDLIEIPSELASVARHLLGRTLIVSDLQAARRILRDSRSWTIVTLDGDITRPSGSITGGSRSQTAGVLARERERRALPARIEQIEAQINHRTSAMDASKIELAELRQSAIERHHALQHAQDSYQAAERALERHSERVEQIQIDVDRLEREQAEAAERLQMLATQHSELSTRHQEISDQREQISAERARLADALTSYRYESSERLSTLTAELAAMRERLRAARRERERTRERLEEIAQVIANQDAERGEIDAQRNEQDRQRELAKQHLAELGEQRMEAQEALEPLTLAQEQAADSIATAEREADAHLEHLRAAEHKHDQARLDLARVQDEEAFLTERIRNDLEIDDPNALLAVAGETSEADERQIRRLRERLRRMSAIGEDVLIEHEQESERLAYLEGQLADVDQTASSLRRVLGELHQQMSERFTSTFSGVAAEFEKTFTRLFGGGAARLSLSDDDAGAVDIVARPPGKRFQGLNQLSGGERALTAVALLVAIQRVNPSPFALLDEVDAALDESNVVRFRDEIRALTDDTQFIIITHNRGTIEGADTLYGITMSADGASQVVSLRLDEAIRAVEDDAQLESIGVAGSADQAS